MRNFLKLLPLVFLLVACGGAATSLAGVHRTSATGTVMKPEVTSFMYGTHTLMSAEGRLLYALKSDSIDLDGYVGRKVTVEGEKVSGYPIEGGPELLNVTSVE